MVRYIACLVCAASLLLVPAFAQTQTLEPLSFASGAVLDFHLQTRFHPDVENDADLLPKGAILRVKLLSPVDSHTTPDGGEIRGVVTEAMTWGDKAIIHPGAQKPDPSSGLPVRIAGYSGD